MERSSDVVRLGDADDEVEGVYTNASKGVREGGRDMVW